MLHSGSNENRMGTQQISSRPCGCPISDRRPGQWSLGVCSPQSKEKLSPFTIVALHPNTPFMQINELLTEQGRPVPKDAELRS